MVHAVEVDPRVVGARAAGCELDLDGDAAQLLEVDVHRLLGLLPRRCAGRERRSRRGHPLPGRGRPAVLPRIVNSGGGDLTLAPVFLVALRGRRGWETSLRAR